MKVVTAAGRVIDLGTIETAPTIGITDYSRRVTDDYGVTTVVKRDFALRLSARLSLPTEQVDSVQRSLAGLRATPATWVADDQLQSLSVRGFFKDFALDIAMPPLSYCTLTVEGLGGDEPFADPGGDPAPIGQASTLRLIQPADIADATLVATSVAETDYPQWSALKSYPIGERVLKAATHRIYESSAAANVGNDPVGASGKWTDIGPTNRWAMFDQALGSITSANDAIEVTLSVGDVNAVALLDVVANSVRVRSAGYDRTIAAAAGAVTFLDLPNTAGQVVVTVTGFGPISVGTLLLGKLVGLGVTEASPTAGITDYSRKDTDDFGEVTIVERAWAKRMGAAALIRTEAVDMVLGRIASVRAQPSLWIGDDELDSLTVYGFFKDCSIAVAEGVSKLSLTIEGLSTAGTVAPLRAAVDWPDVGDPLGNKPDDNATVGGTIGVDVKSPSGEVPTAADIFNPRFDLGPDGRLTAIDFSGSTKELGQIDLDAIGGASKDALAGAMAALDQADQTLEATLAAAVQRVDAAVADARNQADQALGAAEGRLDQKVSDANQAIGAAEGRLDRALTDAATANQAALQRLTDALGTLEDTSADAFAAGDGARRVVEDAIDKLSQAQLAASLTNGATRQILASAGIYIDPASGTARIYGVDKAANDITEAEIRLSAAEGSIRLRVTRTDLDAAILTAQLGGANADLGPLLSRIANAEINLDALGAAIRLKADQTLLGELAGRVTTVRADLDAATGALSLKADSATVTGLNARVASAEATLTALGDVSSYATSASAIRLLDGQAADNAENTLRALLASDAGARSNVEQLGLAYQSLTARIIDGDTAEAQQRNLLTARVRDTEASILTERLARVDAVSAIAGEIETFRADMDGSLGVVGTKVAAVSQAGESTATTVRVIGAAVDQDGDAALRAMLAGDAAAASAAAQIAVLREETVTRSVAGELSLVTTRQDLIARLAGNSAQFTVQIATLADTTQTISRRVETFTATFNAALGVVDNRTTVAARDGESTATTVRVIGAVVDQDGDAALRALLAGDATGVAAAAQVAVLREETTSRMVAGELSLITTRQDLIARLNGNSASFSREISTLTDQQQSLARDVTTIRTQFDGNTADVSSKLIALAAADQTLGGRIDAFRAVFDGNAAEVGSQLIALAAADQTLSGRIDVFRAVFDGNAADVGSRLIALATADQTLSGRIDAFRAVFDGNAADVSSRLIGLATADQTLSGRIDAFRAAYDGSTADVASQLVALATADQTLGGRIDQFRAVFDGNTADVASKLIALATADQTLSGQIDAFRAAYDGNTADVASKLVALATADETLGGRIDAFRAVFDGNTADVGSQLLALATADQTLGGRIDTFRAVFDGNAADVGSQLIALAAADQTLSGRIDDFHAAFDGNTADVGSKLIALATEDQTLSGRIDEFHAAFDGNTADVASKLIALAAADQTLGGRIDAFQSVFDGNTADVSSKLIALATADQTLSGRIDAFRSVFDGNTADVDSQLTALATADQTLAGRLDRYGADFDGNKAAVQTQLVAQADATGAVAGHLETLQTTVAGNTAKITETSSSVDGLKLKRGVELNSNGHITGWQANNDGSRGDFTIVTDTLKVIRPGATAQEEGHTVFAIGDDGTVYVLGKLRAGSIEADMLQVNSAVVPAFATFSTTIDGPGWDGSAGEGGSAGGRVIDEKMS